LSQPPPPQFGQPAATPQWTGPPLADWGQRALAWLMDQFAPFAVAGILYVIVRPLGILAYVAALGYVIWNLVQQGSTGQTVGKKQVGIRLLREADGQPVGAGISLGRWLLNAVFSFGCGIPALLDYLFPLWDPKRQRLVDKMLHTVVVVG